MLTTLIVFLTFFAAAQDQEAAPPDPQQTLERGAYVEEYERDLGKAEKLYALAAEVARAKGDDETAKAAAAALQRVQARQAGAPAAAATSQDEAIVERIGELLFGLSTVPLGVDSDDPEWEHYKAITSDLAVYGDATVPWLEQLLEPRAVEIGPFMVQVDTRMAARVLAMQGTDGANAALARALQSTDPLTRRAVVDNLSLHRHRSLLEQAARDPVPQVREEAIDALVRVRAPELLPLIEPEALAGDRGAVDWLAATTPTRFLELMQAVEPDSLFMRWATNAVDDAELPPTTATVDALLKVAREVEEERAAEILEALRRNFFSNRGRWSMADDLKKHVEAEVLAAPDAYPNAALSELLAEVGDFAAFEHLSRDLTSWPSERTDRDSQWLRNACRGMAKGLPHDDFDDLARLFRELAPNPRVPDDTLDQWSGDAVSALIRMAGARPVSATSVTRGFEGLAGVRRTSYYEVVRSWVDRVQSQLREEPGSELLLPILREMLENSQQGSGVREVAVRSLATLGDFGSMSRVLEHHASSNPRVSQAVRMAVESLYEQDPERTSEILVQAIRDGRTDPGMINYLGDAHELAAFQSIWPSLDEEREQISALHTLVTQIEGPEADEVIVDLYPRITHTTTRKTAIARFGNHLYEPAIPLLGQALDDPEFKVRDEARNTFQKFKAHREALEEFAAWSLGDRAAREQVDELIELLKSEDDAVVLGAVKAIGAVRGRAALPELVKLLQRDDEQLQAAVYEAIERIGG